MNGIEVFDADPSQLVWKSLQLFWFKLKKKNSWTVAYNVGILSHLRTLLFAGTFRETFSATRSSDRLLNSTFCA